MPLSQGLIVLCPLRAAPMVLYLLYFKFLRARGMMLYLPVCMCIYMYVIYMCLYVYVCVYICVCLYVINSIVESSALVSE